MTEYRSKSLLVISVTFRNWAFSMSKFYLPVVILIQIINLFFEPVCHFSFIHSKNICLFFFQFSVNWLDYIFLFF